MEVAPDQQIPYAASVIMEIWQEDDGHYAVEVSVSPEYQG